MILILCYLAIINATAFLLMLIDKRRAKHRKRRISEKVLLITSAIGGSFGTLMAMYAFRHKTKRVKFTAGVPFMMFVHFGAFLWYLR